MANSKGMGRTTQSVHKKKGLKKNLLSRLPKESVPSNSENLPSRSLEESLPSCSLEDCSVTCPVCLDPIIEATDETNGQEAIFCENICNSWLHRQCAGLYARTKGPFYCPHCHLIKITPDLSVEERTTRSLLLKERWNLMQDGMECKSIKIRFNKILMANKVHGEAIDSKLILSQNVKSSSSMETASYV